MDENQPLQQPLPEAANGAASEPTRPAEPQPEPINVSAWIDEALAAKKAIGHGTRNMRQFGPTGIRLAAKHADRVIVLGAFVIQLHKQYVLLQALLKHSQAQEAQALAAAEQARLCAFCGARDAEL